MIKFDGRSYRRSALLAELTASWREKAACKGLGRLMGDPTRRRAAKEVCWGCSVRGECRAWVLGLKPAADSSDVTAALTPDERYNRRTPAAHTARGKAAQ